MQHKPNLIQLAVQAAGGRDQLATDLGLEPWRVSHWYRRQPHLPAGFVLELCSRGANTIHPIRVAKYVAEQRTGRIDLAEVWPMAEYVASRLGTTAENVANAVLAYAHDRRIKGAA